MYQLPPASNGCPDRFVLVRSEHGIHVLAGWSGGYLDGDSWRLSTAIKEAVFAEDNTFRVTTKSGSSYDLRLDRYGFTGMTASIFVQMREEATKLEVMNELVDEEDAYSILSDLV